MEFPLTSANTISKEEVEYWINDSKEIPDDASLHLTYDRKEHRFVLNFIWSRSGEIHSKDFMVFDEIDSDALIRIVLEEICE